MADRAGGQNDVALIKAWLRSKVLRGAFPKVDAALLRVHLDGIKFIGGKVEIFEGGHVFRELTRFTRADKGGGDPRIAQYPRQSHLGEALTASFRDLVQPANPAEVLLTQVTLLQRIATGLQA